ncbi:MAG: hypothetical protein AAGF93_00285 [Cyanobacteria bacterium P01_H01_bin.105]
MGLLEKLLELYEDQSKTLVIVLLGIVIAGSIGGGLWINSLQSSLNQQQALREGRIEYINERYRTLIVKASDEHKEVIKGYEIFKANILASFEKTKRVANQLDSAVSSLNPPQNIATLQKELLTEVDTLESTIKAIEVPSTPFLNGINEASLEYRYPDSSDRSPGQFLIPTLVVTLLICFVTTWLVLRIVKSRKVRR